MTDLVPHVKLETGPFEIMNFENYESVHKWIHNSFMRSELYIRNKIYNRV